MPTPDTTDLRVRVRNAAPLRPERELVLYWMTAARRSEWNFALDRAAALARELAKPLVVLEALRCDYPWASARLHRFVLDGMRDNARAFADRGVLYYPYVEPRQGAGRGLLAALGRRAAAVVTDEFPAFFLPRMLAAAASKLDVRLESVDSNGLLPIAVATQAFPTAYAFRRFLQRLLPPFLDDLPSRHPLRGAKPPVLATLGPEIESRWPPASAELLAGGTELARLPIDHGVASVAYRGGSLAARAALTEFLERRLPRYADAHNHPDDDVASGLSPYLHFGHLSVHEVFSALAAREGWSPAALGAQRSGKREGFWGMGAPAQAFLDELVTWRELGLNFCAKRPDYDRYESLPDWARRTLAAHAADTRSPCYDLEAFESARTHDPLWNAAQTQLVHEGRIHNYLRMLWGKKILEWSAAPQEALEVMIHLNNKYAVDGRDPNSYTGIAWVLGRHDRPWAPERPIFGSVRYMSSANTLRKLRVRAYLRRWGADGIVAAGAD